MEAPWREQWSTVKQVLWWGIYSALVLLKTGSIFAFFLGSFPAPYLDDTMQINSNGNPKLRSQHALHFCTASQARKALPRL